ncbi:EAL domain-containing protein [Pseudalkalibacillus berkeleyi]|uniref:EAL domain-containing protein n=1 Tax=Pseudalkalibacillus berkeleyi TaxID=1069813 RepID=A0ABS9H065_9BACL|nr:EAL domain-containing protein [Pseudalkalibacillus berkeleyi]MCF6138387.1 EAL domain-containing protein [Pseudalkalibacillus berkeleyi]
MFNRLQEEQLRSIFNGFKDMVFLMEVDQGPEFRYVTANDSALKNSGVTASAFGKNMREVLTENVFNEIQQAYETAYFTKEPHHYEIETEVKGASMVGETILTPILNEKDECTHILAAVRNITNKKRIESELQSSKERYRYLYENTPAMYFTLNKAGTLLSFNKTGSSRLGFTNEELIGKPFTRLIDVRDQSKFKAFISQLESGTDQSIEIRLVHKNKQSFWVSQRMNVVTRNEEIEIVCVSHEVQEQKETEAQLKGQKRIFELIATDIMLDEILEVTAKTLEDHIEHTFCTIHLYSQENNELQLAAAPSICENHSPQLSTMNVGEDVSGCGRAAALKKPVVVSNIEDDPLSLHLHNFFFEYSIGSYWVMPILSSKNELLGIVTIYSLKTRLPSKTDQRLIKMYTDIAVLAIEQKQTKQALRESETRLKIMTENMSDLIVIFDSKGIVNYVSPAYQKIFGRLPELENTFSTYLHNDDRENVLETFETLVRTKERQDVECKYRNADGEYVVIEARAMPVLDANEEVKQVVVVARDITKRKKTEETIKHMAYHDSLTDLPNRRKFQEDLDQLIMRCKNRNLIAGVLFLDMDRFKVINDSLGHAFGDSVLSVVASKLKSVIQENGHVYRMSGDEFTVLVPKVIHISDLTKIAKKISRSFDEPIIIDGHEFHISFSIGVALYPDDGEDVESLLAHSDMAMYRAKEKGRNAYEFYRPSMNINNYERLVLENDLHKAIENKELILHYQPRIDVAANEIIGVEALVRWNHPQWGIISPGQFIPLAEETGLIVKIDNWVLENACKQNKQWQEKGYPPIRMAVNFSARQFLQRNLANSIRKVLQDVEIDGSWLEIEITESTLMKYEESIVQSLEDLEKMGIRIAIDDFGTGYSSLSYLKKFHVHSLKIDQSFVRGIGKSPDEEAIAKAVINLGHSMKMRVVAEGVETGEQLAFLESQNCNEVQGYHFYRPMEADMLDEILKSNRLATL